MFRNQMCAEMKRILGFLAHVKLRQNILISLKHCVTGKRLAYNDVKSRRSDRLSICTVYMYDQVYYVYTCDDVRRQLAIA